MDAASPEEIVEMAVARGARSIAYTYNDPVIFLEYAVDVARVARARGIKNVAVTAGYIGPDAREEFFQWMDAANIDLKAFTDDFYRSLCSAGLGAVQETLEYVKHETDVWLEITTLVIPGRNDSDGEIAALSDWVMEKLGPDTPRTPPATLTRAREIAMQAGLRYVYTGNVHDERGQSTCCPGCGTCVIGRDWYDITDWRLAPDGRCGACGERIAGVFEARPGHWGARRVPMRLGGDRKSSVCE